MPGEAELIMFAIRSAIKLGQQSREAYVDATRRQVLVLPLPSFPVTITVEDAGGYFLGAGARRVGGSPRIGVLVDKFKNRTALTDAERDELLGLRRECFVRDLADAGLPVTAADDSTFQPEDLKALLAVRQWSQGTDPTPSALQRVGGTLIEIGVDYFATMPGAISTHSTAGKLAQAVLAGLEPIKFSEIALEELPARLFVATLETVAAQPALLTGDPKIQELVKVTAKGLATDVGARVATMRARGDSDSSREERIAEWGELVFRSILGSGGRMVLEDPKTFLGVKPAGEAALISEVGKGILGLIVDDPDGNLSRVFSREGVDVVVKAALGVVAKHPEILVDKKDAGLRALLASVAGELSQYDTLATPGMVPEITRVILEKTGENLEQLWPDLAKKPQDHLLLTAAQTTLAVLTRKPPAGARWKPTFGRDDLLAVTSTVFDELAQNPSWLLAAAGNTDANLRVALEASLGVVRTRGTTQLSVATATAMLQASIRAVALRSEFLDPIPAGRPLAGQPVIAAALDAVLASIYDPPGARAAWRLARADAATSVTQLALAELAKQGASPQRVAALDAFMKTQADTIQKGQAWDLDSFATGLRTALGG
ncbi:MAG TPA: hypothetical protein VHT71_05370 [Methylomirabilota bacterium]|jgi:hypothetical protein|nr:hypothetical protein [Methylomirabilota bacterium]